MVSVPDMSREQRNTAVVVDDMYVVRCWSFNNIEKYGAVARRYKTNLIKYVLAGTRDRYISQTLTSSLQQHMCRAHMCCSIPARIYEVSDHYRATDPQELFSANKAGLLNFLC